MLKGTLRKFGILPMIVIGLRYSMNSLAMVLACAHSNAQPAVVVSAAGMAVLAIIASSGVDLIHVRSASIAWTTALGLKLPLTIACAQRANRMPGSRFERTEMIPEPGREATGRLAGAEAAASLFTGSAAATFRELARSRRFRCPSI